MEWQAFCYLQLSTEALSVWVAEVRTHFLFGSFGISMFGHVIKVAKKNYAGCYALPWRIPTVVLLYFCLSCFGPLTWSLNVVDGYDLSRMSVAMLWSIDVPLTEYRMPWDIFKFSNPGYVERSRRWFTMILALRSRVSRESMGERGSNSFFAQNLIFLFEPRQFNCDRLPRCCRPFWSLYFPLTVALGLNFECSFPWTVSHVGSSIDIWYVAGARAHWCKW